MKFNTATKNGMLDSIYKATAEEGLINYKNTMTNAEPFIFWAASNGRIDLREYVELAVDSNDTVENLYIFTENEEENYELVSTIELEGNERDLDTGEVRSYRVVSLEIGVL